MDRKTWKHVATQSTKFSNSCKNANAQRDGACTNQKWMLNNIVSADRRGHSAVCFPYDDDNDEWQPNPARHSIAMTDQIVSFKQPKETFRRKRKRGRRRRRRMKLTYFDLPYANLLRPNDGRLWAIFSIFINFLHVKAAQIIKWKKIQFETRWRVAFPLRFVLMNVCLYLLVLSLAPFSASDLRSRNWNELSWVLLVMGLQ